MGQEGRGTILLCLARFLFAVHRPATSTPVLSTHSLDILLPSNMLPTSRYTLLTYMLLIALQAQRMPKIMCEYPKREEFDQPVPKRVKSPSHPKVTVILASFPTVPTFPTFSTETFCPTSHISILLWKVLIDI